MSPTTRTKPAGIGELLPLVARELHLRAMPTIRGAGITPAQFWMLKSIQVQGPCTPSKLAAQFGVRAPSITTLLNGLEARGLVERVRGGGDRRSVSVKTTAKGERLLAAVFKTVSREAVRAAGASSVADRTAAIRVLQIMFDSLERSSPSHA